MHACEYWLHVFSHGSQRPISPWFLKQKNVSYVSIQPALDATGWRWTCESYICCQFLRWPQTTVSLTHCCQTVPPHSQECRTWIKHFWLLCDGCVCEQFTVLHVFPFFFFLPMFVFNLKRRLYWPEPVTITISALSRNKSSGMFCFPKILLLWNQHVAGWFLVFPAHIWLLSLSLCSRSPARQHPNRQLRSLLESLHSSRY